MKDSLSNGLSAEQILKLKSKGEQKAVEFKVAKLSSKLAKMLKNYREMTERDGIPAESVQACFLEMKIQKETKRLAELISRSGSK